MIQDILLAFCLPLLGLAYYQAPLLLPPKEDPLSSSITTSIHHLGAETSLQSNTTLLEPGKTIKRELGPGNTDRFRIQVPMGQYVRVIIEQRGIDTSVQLLGRGGQVLAEAQNPYGFIGTKSLSLISDGSDDYLIQIRGEGGAKQAGHYEIKAEPPRAPSPADLNRIEAERAFNQASDFERDQKKLQELKKYQEANQKKRQAIEKYQEAKQKWAESGDTYWEAVALFSIADSWFSLTDRPKAIDYFEQALSFQESIGDKRGMAFSLKGLGSALGQEGKLSMGAEISQRALPLWRDDGDQLNEAITLNNLGVIYTFLYEPQEAINYHAEALRLRQNLRDTSGSVRTLNNIGALYLTTGEPYSALQTFNQAISVIGEIKEPTRVDRITQGSLLNKIGRVYDSLGDLELALNYYNQAFEICKLVEDQDCEGSVLSNLGNAYYGLGDPQNSSRSLMQALEKQNRWGKVYTLINLGDACLLSNDPQKALDYFNRALNSLTEIQDHRAEAAALDRVGRIKLMTGDLQSAENAFKRALALWQVVGERQGEATTLYGLARLEKSRNNLAESRRLSEAAINILENFRMKIIDDRLRASYFASVRDYYEFEIDLLMQLDRQHTSEAYNQLALQFSERAHARVLLESLNDTRADLCPEGNPALLEQRRTLEQKVQTVANRHRLLTMKESKDAREKEQAIQGVERELVAAINQLEEVEARIRRESPCYAALAGPSTLGLKDIQGLLDADTILLQFFLGGTHSYLWAISADSLRSFELAGRAEIESAALRLRELLLERAKLNSGEREEDREARIARAEAQFPQAATHLGNLLMSQAAPMLGNKRLAIVADGALQLVPFGLLQISALQGQDTKASLPLPERFSRRQTQVPGKRPTATPYRPLIADHEIVALPSASVLAQLRRDSEGRHTAPRSIAVFADPVFDSKDFRLKTVAGKSAKDTDNPPGAAELSQALRDVEVAGGGTLRRLVFSRLEAQAIQRVTSGEQPLVALDFDARRDTALSQKLTQYRIIHLATHALLNNKHPELSGIVLSLFNREGQPQNGFIKLHEIYRLKLPAELVVLSACQTALGREVRGEGLVGLARGFMQAGVPRVVASLWKVDDAATSEWMSIFYEQMMRGGKRPADALRAAQLQMMKRSQWQSPFYWGAFVLQGDWR